MENSRVRKRIAILGSTGSIGTQALEVIAAHPELFEAEVLTANSNCELLIQQAISFRPNAVVIAQKNCYKKVADALAGYPVKVWAGHDAISQVVTMEGIDMVLSAMVGFSGLVPTIHAIEAGKDIALANKESLVVAGELVMKAARKKGVRIIPVDSEHSAIFQCLAGEMPGSIEKIYLTASGGPFRGWTANELKHVTREQALNHPNWKMGNKITIDSASMMNKGLEVIEAGWLFGLRHDQIDVVIHPQSIVHSLVQFVDGSLKAQLGLPDMKLPILYALAYPRRITSALERFDFRNFPSLNFETADSDVFRNLRLAYFAMERGGNLPCILNAANEVAVASFLKDRIAFNKMPDVIEHCLHHVAFRENPLLPDLISTHHATVETALNYIETSLSASNIVI
jgi:1-deoxy-D-xylulose-5-phosphate reductoisomerase